MPLFVTRLLCPASLVAVAYLTYSGRILFAAGLFVATVAIATLGARTNAPSYDRWGRGCFFGYLAIASLGLMIWAGCLIRASSVVGPDGLRYYALFDDSMISLRYASNFAHGHGLVWNPGERVEGFTNPLMVAVMTIPTAIFADRHAVVAMHVFGIASLILNALVVTRIALHAFQDLNAEIRVTLAAIAATASLVYYPLVYWSVFGMETGLLALLAACALWIGECRPSDKVSYLFAVLLALIVWTRPDAAVPAVILWIVRFTHKPARRAAWVEAVLAAAIVAMGLVARRAYYGEWLPNTYFLKMTRLDSGVRLESGIAYVKQFCEQSWPALVLGWLTLAVIRDRLQIAIVSLMSAVVVYQAWVGGDPWLYWRILCPYFPLLVLACMRGIVGLLKKRALSYVLPSVLVCVAGCLYAADKPFAKQIFGDEVPYGSRSAHRNILTALELKRICNPEARVGLVWAGTIPYYSGLGGVDFLGKSDKHIARLKADPDFKGNGMRSLPGHNKYDLKYSIETLRPDYVELAQWGHDDVTQFVRENYVLIRGMWLLRGSPNIRWDLVGR